jgi:hypothetical protein
MQLFVMEEKPFTSSSNICAKARLERLENRTSVIEKTIRKKNKPSYHKIYNFIFQFVSGQPALQALAVRDSNLTPLELDSAVIHTPPKQDSAVHHTTPDQDSALIQTSPKQDLPMRRSLEGVASAVSTSIILNFFNGPQASF